MKLPLLIFLLATSFLSMGPEYTYGAIYIRPDPFPCSTNLCIYACNQISCGLYKCPSGYCVINKKLEPTPVCLCIPRVDHPSMDQYIHK